MKLKKDLAIVIPAYKLRYLEATLASILNQNDKRFILYIGDDCSPENLFTIVSKFTDKIEIKYVRFVNNLGRESLTKSWERIIQEVKEPWIWLFSDDDVMDINCVENFYKSLDETKEVYDIYRFNVKRINRNNFCIGEEPASEIENSILSAYDFYKLRLKKELDSFAVEYVFRRNIYQEVGRFQEFPLAWASDDATWIKIAYRFGIFQIPKSTVYWRYSGENISSNRDTRKIQASLAYIRWSTYFFNKEIKDDYDNISLIQYNWINHQIALIGRPQKLTDLVKWSWSISQIFKKPFFRELLNQARKYSKYSQNFTSFVKFISKWRK